MRMLLGLLFSWAMTDLPWCWHSVAHLARARMPGNPLNTLRLCLARKLRHVRACRTPEAQVSVC